MAERIGQRRKTVLKHVAPAILANAACVFLFSVVDGIFVGNGAGIHALGAVNLALPFVLISNALNAMASIGGVAVTAIRFGRGDKEGAQAAFMHSLTLNLSVGILITLAGCLLNRPLSSLMGADESYIKETSEYVFWWSAFAVFNSTSLNLQSFCRNDGSPMLVAITNVIGTAVNIFLDWLFVFPLGMGVKGAAIATGLSQTAGLLVVCFHFLLKKGQLKISKYRPQAKLFRKILFRGLPEAIAQFSTPVTTLCMNYVLARFYGDIGINAFSIITYLSSFTMAVFFGASEGLQPLFGNAYGAKSDGDLKYYYRTGQIISVVGSALCVALYVSIPQLFCRLFGADDITAEFTSSNMAKYCWGFIIGSVNTLLSAYFYSTKRSAQAIALNVTRSIILNSAFIIFLPLLFGKELIWHAFGIYETAVLILAVVLKRISEKNGVVYK